MGRVLDVHTANTEKENRSREEVLDNTLQTTFEDCRRNQNPSLVVSVVKDGKTVFSKAYGNKDNSVDSKEPVTTKTLFGIGSLTKIFANLLVQKYMSNDSRYWCTGTSCNIFILIFLYVVHYIA
jgi:hypothetical protein